jgi:hypothetical protein
MEKVFSKFQAIYIRMSEKKHMKVVGNRIKCRDMELISTLMEQSIRANGKKTSIMAKVNTNFQMELYIMVNGRII